MAAPHAEAEDDVRQLVAKVAKAIRAMDLEGLEACFDPDIVSFDVGPQLQSVGAAAKMQNWAMAFAIFRPPLDYEIRDLTITVSDDLAFVHSFNRLSGTVKNAGSDGNRVGPWVRYTGVFRKVRGVWLIAHDHVSAPIDFASGRALLHLEP